MHSPFVYAFIEKVLHDGNNVPFQNKLATFLNTEKIITLDSTAPTSWKEAVHNRTDKETAVIIPSIHKTPLHTQCWNELAADLQVKLSIDLYKTGLLFFKDEFKEKQHFVLKYA